MPARLSHKSIKDIKREMSIAGDPEKIVGLTKEIFETLLIYLDTKNIAELENMAFALRWLEAQVKFMVTMQRNKQHPKI